MCGDVQCRRVGKQSRVKHDYRLTFSQDVLLELCVTTAEVNLITFSSLMDGHLEHMYIIPSFGAMLQAAQ